MKSFLIRIIYIVCLFSLPSATNAGLNTVCEKGYDLNTQSCSSSGTGVLLSNYISNSSIVNSFNYTNSNGYSEFNYEILKTFPSGDFGNLEIGYNTYNYEKLKDGLFKDFNFDFNSEFISYFGKSINTTKTGYGYKNILICGQALSLSGSDNFNCRTYYSEKTGTGFLGNEMFEFTYPFSKKDNLKIDFEDLKENQKKCFKDSNLCIEYNGTIFLKSILNETIFSNTSYFNNQLVYINNSGELNVNSSVKVENINSDKILLIGGEDYLFLQENNNLKVFNKDYNLINTFNNINIRNYVFNEGNLYFLNSLNDKEIYIYSKEGSLSKILIGDSITSKFYIFNNFLYFVSNKTPYKYNLLTEKLYKKAELLLNSEINNFLIFPLDRNSKEELILF